MKPDVLKTLRKDAKMTQQQLADLLCVSKPTVSQWERGINQPKPEIEMMIANHFNVSLDFLNGDSAFSRFEKVMNKEFIPGTSYMEVFDQIIQLPAEYRSSMKFQLDAMYALAREREREQKRRTSPRNVK